VLKYFIICFLRLAILKTGIGIIMCVVPINNITQTLSCVSPHMVAYDKRMLPRRFHYINNHRIEDVLLLLDETWQADR